MSSGYRNVWDWQDAKYDVMDYFYAEHWATMPSAMDIAYSAMEDYGWEAP